MRSSELKEKINKAEEKVNKIKNTIGKHEKQAEKKLTIIKQHKWDENNKYCKEGTADHHECYWMICEYQNKLDDIKTSNKKLKDSEIILSNWIEKYIKQINSENIINNEMPKIFTQCRNELADEWTQIDIRHKEIMKQQKLKLEHDEFRKLYKYTEEERLNKNYEDFYKINFKDAELFIIDFYNRVKEITGIVTDWGNIFYKGKALNGWVVGENGMAKVETILAGGYNIQKLHMRVLVQEIKRNK